MINYEIREKVDPKSVTVNGVPASEVARMQQSFADEINSSTTDFTLKINQHESVYEFVPVLSNNQDGSVITYGQEGEVLYLNTLEKLKIQTQKYPKRYLVTDSLISKDWKISRETKELCGLTVKKATYIPNDSMQVEAWYAPQLPYSVGPNGYNGLPGLILGLYEKSYSEKDGEYEQNFTCTKIEILKNAKGIERPTKGEVITPKQLEEIWDELEKRANEMRGEGVDKD